MERKLKKAVSVIAGLSLLASMCLPVAMQFARAGDEPEVGDRRLLARVAGDTHCHGGSNVKTLNPIAYETGQTWQNNHPATFMDPATGGTRIEDVTGYDTIELDMYIADEANRAAYYDWKDQMTIILIGKRIGSADDISVPYPVPTEVGVGSNLVELDLYIAASQGLDLSRIHTISFKTHPNNAFDYNFGHGWQGTSNDGLKTARSFTFTYQNIYAVKTGRWADGLFHGGNYHFVHTAATTTDYASIHQSMAAPKDASSGDYIQFDFYVSDLEALKAIKTTGDNSAFGMFIVRLRTTDPGKGEADGNWYSADFTSQVVRSGRNTVLIPKTSFGVSGSANWNRIAKIEFYSEPFMTPASFPKLFTLGLTNFRTLNATPPAFDSGTLVHSGDIAKIMEPEHLQSVYSYNWINSYVGFDRVWNLTEYDYFEFDFYVSDMEAFKSEANYNGQLLRIITSANAETGELNRFGPWMVSPDFKDQITRSGWNHIVIPVSALGAGGGGNPPGAGDPATARGVEFWVEANTQKTHLQRYVTRYANIGLRQAGAVFNSFYGDGMLFLRDEDFVVNGTGLADTDLTVSLFKTGAATAAQSKSATVSDDGVWSVSFDGVEGGYDTYEIAIFEAGLEMSRIKDVVFGELWLASGQSNMDFNMCETPEGHYEFYNNPAKTYMNGNVRALITPPTYSAAQPSTPNYNIPGSLWTRGDQQNFIHISGVAYHYADTLQKELGMPVGILDASLGGTGIYSWLSREAIEGSAEIKQHLVDTGRYLAMDAWNPPSHNAMTVNYNHKIAPLSHLRISGVIWYQGEDQVSETKGIYTKALQLLYDSWSEAFGFSGDMPFVFTHLAPYNYGGTLLPSLSEDMSAFQKANNAGVAQVAIYDVPLSFDYNNDFGSPSGGPDPIHPYNKRPVGVRMGRAALAKFYDLGNAPGAPVYKSHTLGDGYIDIKFSNVGDGLAAKTGPLYDLASRTLYDYTAGDPEQLYGFSICGDDGIYVNANARVTGSDTVRVWSSAVEDPKAAAYAFSPLPTSANLAAKNGAAPVQMAIPFRTSDIDKARYSTPKDWAYAELSSSWHTVGDVRPGLYDAWKVGSGSASLSVSASDKTAGAGSLQVSFTSGGAKAFSVQPVITPKDLDESAPAAFGDQERDYTKYKTLTFKVKNTSGKDLTLTGLRLKCNAVWYSAELAGGGVSKVIPKNSEWITVTADLDRLWKDGAAKFVNGDKLSILNGLAVAFEKAEAGDAGAVLLDEFMFGTEALHERETEVIDGDLVHEGSTFLWGPSLNPGGAVNANWANRIYELPGGMDLSSYPYLQMDMYCDDWDTLLAQNDFWNVTLRLFLDPTDRSHNICVNVGMSKPELELVADRDTGFARMKMSLAGLKATTVYGVMVYMELNQQLQPAQDYQLGYTNIYALNYVAPAPDPTGNILLTEGDKTTRLWGPSLRPDAPELVNPNWMNKRYDPFKPIDITGATDLEFDFYCDDWENFLKTPDLMSMNLRLYNTANLIDSEQLTVGILFSELSEAIAASADGWVKVKVDIFNRGITKVHGIMFFMEHNQIANPKKDYQIRLRNLYAIHDDSIIPPAPPEEGLKLAGGEVFPYAPGATVSASWINKTYFLPVDGVDFALYNRIVLDFYVSDWEAFAALKDFSSLNIRMYKGFNDTDWVQTGISRADLLKFVKDGWNRIQIPVNADTEIYSFMIFFEGNQSMNPKQAFRLGYANIYAQSVEVVDNRPKAPKVPDQPVTPDASSAAYLSACEGLIDGGTWAPVEAELDTDAKTEGKASIFNVFHAGLGIRASALRLTLEDFMNLKGGTELRFDLYISDIALLKNRTKMAVRLASDTRGTEDYIQWDIAKFGALKTGWNAVRLSLSDISSRSGSFDLTSVGAFNLFCEEQNLEGDEMLRINLDNVRVFGAASNTDNSKNPGTGVDAPFVVLSAAGISGAVIVLYAVTRKRKKRGDNPV